MRRDCSSAANGRLTHDDRDSQTRRFRARRGSCMRATTSFVERDTRTAHARVRWLARRLAAREAAALAALAGEAHVPRLLEFDGAVVRRSYLPGVPLYEAPPRSRAYFVHALRVLRRLHRAGVAHNDLAKEANWLIAAATPARSSTSSSRRCSPTRTRAVPQARLRRPAAPAEAQAHVPAARAHGAAAARPRAADAADAAVARARQARLSIRHARGARLARARSGPLERRDLMSPRARRLG